MKKRMRTHSTTKVCLPSAVEDFSSYYKRIFHQDRLLAITNPDQIDALHVPSTITTIEMTDNNYLQTNTIPKSVGANIGTLLGTSNKRIRSNEIGK